MNGEIQKVRTDYGTFSPGMTVVGLPYGERNVKKGTVGTIKEIGVNNAVYGPFMFLLMTNPSGSDVSWFDEVRPYHPPEEGP